MNDPIIFESEIKKEIDEAQERQLFQLRSVIQKSKERNEFLDNELSNYNSTEPIDFPPSPEPPSREIIEEFYKSRRCLLLAQKNRDRLIQVKRQLSERISTARDILQREQEEKLKRAISSLSPTVARLKNIPLTRVNNFTARIPIESDTLKKQLEAISALKEGARPRQYGVIKYDFNKQMSLIEKEINQLKTDNDQLLQNITNNINGYLDDPVLLLNELKRREEDISSFHKFAQVYYNSINEIEKLKYTKLLQVLKTIRNDVQNKRFDELYVHLTSEKEMIDEQLSLLGTGDFETNKLKSEIEFQLLYLGHLTAVAGKALSRISSENGPSDPVEKMRADIIRMNHRLSSLNPA